MVELHFSYLNAIQTMCPHILRYLATAVIINRGRRNALKDLVKVIQQVGRIVCDKCIILSFH